MGEARQISTCGQDNLALFGLNRLADLYAGIVQLPAETPMVMPGDSFAGKFKLITPVAMEPGLRFAIREGGRTVGAGVVSKLLS